MLRYVFFIFIFIVHYAHANREGDMSDPSAFIPGVEKVELKGPSLKEADVLVEEGDYDKAYLVLEEITKKNNNADAFTLLGYVERKRQNFDNSIKMYKKALAINTEHTGALNYLGEVYLELDDLEKAKVCLNKLSLACLYGCSDYTELEEAVMLYIKNYN